MNSNLFTCGALKIILISTTFYRGGCLRSILSTIPCPLQDILPHQPELTKGIFHNHLTKRQLPEVSMLNPLLQIAAGVRFIRNVPPRLRNRQRFGSTRFTRVQDLLGSGFFLPFSSGFVFRFSMNCLSGFGGFFTGWFRF